MNPPQDKNNSPSSHHQDSYSERVVPSKDKMADTEDNLKKEIEEQKRFNTLLAILSCIVGIVIGMTIMCFYFIFGFERILNASEGLFQNVTINFNETKVIEGLTNYINNSGMLK